MRKSLKILPLFFIPLTPLISGCSPESGTDKYRVKFVLSDDSVLVNIGFAIIGDFCNWGNVNEELSDDAIILECFDKGLYSGEKTFNTSITMNYKIVQYGNNILDNRIIEIENIPNRIIVVDSSDVTVNLRWESLD